MIFKKNTKNYKFSSDYWGAKKGFAPHLNYWGRVPGCPPRVYAYASILPTLIPTSVVHDPTTSFNPFLIHSNTILRPSVTSSVVTEMFQSPHSCSCPASLEQTPPSIATNILIILRAHSNLSP